jgi:hypothetical protein
MLCSCPSGDREVIPLLGEMGVAQKGCRRAKVAVFARKRYCFKAAEGAALLILQFLFF